jgi:hypothetical protein
MKGDSEMEPANIIKAIDQQLKLIGSGQRAWPLLEAIYNQPPAVFWPVLIDWWPRVDGFRDWRREYLRLMRAKSKEARGVKYLDKDAMQWFDALPDTFTVYRGCGKRWVRCASWTLDQECAEFFARGGRFSSPASPVVASATISKAAVFFVTDQRNEKEVVLDPYLIGRPKLRAVAPRD